MLQLRLLLRHCHRLQLLEAEWAPHKHPEFFKFPIPQHLAQGADEEIAFLAEWNPVLQSRFLKD